MIGKPTKSKNHILYWKSIDKQNRRGAEVLFVENYLFTRSFLEDDIRYYEENVSDI